MRLTRVRYHLVSFLSSSSKLTLFDVSSTQLAIEHLKQILRAIGSNFALQNLTLRLSENKVQTADSLTDANTDTLRHKRATTRT